ncbi:hypothetical protein DRO61_08135 [Candidatus Bathyarchaeota archaeon]|nr:MAG: hypothetical protein DRO61_08135 [Candidatus Bathyarchaeota archaeon]
MGYIKHHGIAVTSWDEKILKKAHRLAKEIFKKRASPIMNGDINSYLTFFIAPDGSKEGWEESDKDDISRSVFINWINKQAYEDGSNPLDFCEFFYGEDNDESEVTRHN